MRSKPRQAIALVTILMMVPVLAIMMGALFIGLRGGYWQTQMHFNRAGATYVAESGLGDALAQLEANPAWTTGFNKKLMQDGVGTYTVTFNQGAGPFTADDSVNNQDGAHPHSYRGNNSVPAGTQLLVVRATQGTITRRLEVLTGPKNQAIELTGPLLTSGKIKMAGNVSVSGVKALNDSAPSSTADVQSNQTGGGSDLIHYTGGGTINLTGKVLSAGSSSASINLGAYAPPAGSQYNAAQKAIPPVDITGTINSKLASATAYTGGVIPTGDFKYQGDLTVNGDLKLNGGKLYVTGNLTVNGSISGTGSVYVGNETNFKGDASLNGKDRTALYSKGNVILRGFDGEAYLNGLAGTNANVANYWGNAKTGLTSLLQAMNSGSWIGTNQSTVNQIADDLGSPGSGQNNLGKLATEIGNQPAGPTRDFMVTRLTNLQRMFAATDDLGTTDSAVISQYNATGLTDGFIDAVNDLNNTALMPAAFNLVHQIDMNKIGSARFQGLVYTNGAFYSANQVEVVGAVVVNDNGSQVPTTIDGNTVNPGDLVLNNGSDIMFIEDFFKAGGGSMTPASGPPGVRVWMGG